MSEKHTIRNTVIGTVLGGIILTGLLSTWFRNVVTNFLHWVWAVFVFLWRIIVFQIGVPIGLLALLVIISIVSCLHLIRAFRRTEGNSSEYIEDVLFGVTWRWGYHLGNIFNLRAFCPHCDLELSYSEKKLHDPVQAYLRPNFPKSTQFVCEKCNISSEEISGNLSDALNRVEKEIERRLRAHEKDRKYSN